ncbi:MAG TPA: BPSS1780 family membrane protein [Nevskia sp.]|nr:BPSS1780 family membrane protein [Nevskia sp.]
MNTSPTAAAPPPRRLPTARGWDWLAQGFALFGRASGTWILITLIYIVGVVLLMLIPGASLLYSLFSYVFTGGLMLGCASLAAGQGLRLEHLFAGFKAPHLGNLVLLGALYMGLTFLLVFVMLILFFAVFGLSFHDVQQAQHPSPELLLRFALVLVLMLAVMIPLMMGVWLAPALIVLNGIGPVQAFRLSFRACWINFLPLLWYGLIALVLAFIAALPLFLGFLVLVPVLAGSVFSAYRDIFPQPVPQAAVTPPPLA